jgi:hypothetical protein
MAFDGFNLDTASFGRSLAQLSTLNQKTQAENLRRYARTTLSNRAGSGLLQITPPASAGKVGSAARAAGEAALTRDLANIFSGVKLKGQRREQWPDVALVHRRQFIFFKKPGQPLRSDRGRAGYIVDERKVRALFQQLRRRIGKLASGWLASCNALGVSAPSWISRHGAARGSIVQKMSAPMYSIEMNCNVPPNAPGDELERRVPYALRYATSRLEREVAFLLDQDAKKAGFKSSA